MLNIAKGKAALTAYGFGFLRERFADEHPEQAGRFDEVAEELRKFLSLPFHSDGPLAMPSHNPVDNLWHTFIQHTPQYAKFCDDVYDGRFLHHQPRSEQFPVAREALGSTFIELYKHYGPPSGLWFAGIAPEHHAALAAGNVPDAVLEAKWSGWPGWI